MTAGQFDQPPLRIASASQPSGNEPNGKTRTLSVGLENVDDLIADIEQALSAGLSER